MSIDLSSELKRRGLSQAALAKLIDVDRSAVTRWVKWGMPIPEARAVQIEQATGIPMASLRPIAKPQPERGAAA